MPTIASQLDEAFRRAIQAAFALDADPLIAVSQNDRFGDYQSNAAMGLAKQLKTNPRAVAEKIKASLELHEQADEITIAGPGFINVRLSPRWLEKRLGEIAGEARLGIEPVGRPQNVVIDYSGPNIAKQMHVGHLRSTIIGDAASRVLEFQGHSIIRQNHIGDWGTQFGMLLAYLQWDVGALSLRLRDLEEYYRAAKELFDGNPGFRKLALEHVVRLQAGDPTELTFWKKFVDESRPHHQQIYERLGIKLRPEHERGESFYNPMLPQVVAELKDKGLAVQSEGATVVFVEGHENPLIIEKSGGGYLYATTDLAAIRYRVRELGARRIIYVVGSPQSQHFQQVFDVARRASWTHDVSLEHAAFGSVLGEDGKMFRTRTGQTVKLKDLLDEAEQRAYALVTEKNAALPEVQRREIAHAVGIGAVKYADLSKDRVSDYVFSWDKMLALDGNTAPYLQYAYARIRSIFRKSAGSGTASPGTAASAAVFDLSTPHELTLAKHVLRLGEILDAVSRELKPHHLCTYLYDLATRFSGFYENCPVLQSDEPLRSSRLALCDLTVRTMAKGLELLGIEHPEQM